MTPLSEVVFLRILKKYNLWAFCRSAVVFAVQVLPDVGTQEPDVWNPLYVVPAYADWLNVRFISLKVYDQFFGLWAVKNQITLYTLSRQPLDLLPVCDLISFCEDLSTQC